MELVDHKEKRGDSDESIQLLIKPYYIENEVTQYLINKTENSSEIEKLILHGIEQARIKRHLGTMSLYKNKLSDHYKDTLQIKKYMNTLKDLAYTNTYDLKNYLEYKSNFDEEAWPNERDQILEVFEEKPRLYLLSEIYKEEKMYEKLLKWLDFNLSFSHLIEYEKLLVDIYGFELTKLFIKSLDQLASKSGSKGHYRKIVDRMTYIKKLPFGEEAMLKKVEEYKIKYKKRPNFMAILDKYK